MNWPRNLLGAPDLSCSGLSPRQAGEGCGDEQPRSVGGAAGAGGRQPPAVCYCRHCQDAAGGERGRESQTQPVRREPFGAGVLLARSGLAPLQVLLKKKNQKKPPKPPKKGTCLSWQRAAGAARGLRGGKAAAGRCAAAPFQVVPERRFLCPAPTGFAF